MNFAHTLYWLQIVTTTALNNSNHNSIPLPLSLPLMDAATVCSRCLYSTLTQTKVNCPCFRLYLSRNGELSSCSCRSAAQAWGAAHPQRGFDEWNNLRAQKKTKAWSHSVLKRERSSEGAVINSVLSVINSRDCSHRKKKKKINLFTAAVQRFSLVLWELCWF